MRMNIGRMFPAALLVFLLPSFAFAEANRPADKSESEKIKQEDAASLVRQALIAEAEGKLDARAEFLKRALDTDPTYAPAHWHSGEVKIDGKWLSVEAAAKQTSEAGKVAAYRQLRDSLKGTFEDQMKLAKWCAEAGLKAEERTHLMLAVQMQPKNKEAIGKLDLVRHNGQLMSRERRDQLIKDDREAQLAFKKWQPRLIKLRDDILSDKPDRRAAALKALSEIHDLSAIPAIEAIFGAATDDVGLATVAALASMREQPATDSLVRFSILSQDREVRKAAAESLELRSPFAFVPAMVEALEAPVETKLERGTLADGRPIHRLTMFQEGRNENNLVVREGAGTEVLSRDLTRWRTDRSFLDPSRDAARTADFLADRNQLVQRRNEIIGEALAIASGAGRESSAPALWKWWSDVNELNDPVYKPLREDYQYTPPSAPLYSTYRSPGIDIPTLRTHPGCFAAGTIVWTSTGGKSVESIRTGDMVLSQDSETGELVLKPVLTITTGSAPLLKLQFDADSILATRGHPFWVSGVGWQMAKELKPGQWLHTAKGAVLLDSVEEIEAAPVHNLIVADFGTYFVGKDKLLVHDFNLRNATDRVVPGLSPAD